MSATRAASLCIVTLCLATPARAQPTPAVRVDQHLSIAEVGAAGLIQGPRGVNPSRTSADLGIALLATLYPAEIVGIAGEFAAFERPWAAQVTHGRAALVGLKVRTRLITSGTTNWRLFGQLLGGPQWTDVRAGHHVWQPGVGADDYLRHGMTLHVQYDYTFAPDDKRDLSTGRFLVGVALPLGAHD